MWFSLKEKDCKIKSILKLYKEEKKIRFNKLQRCIFSKLNNISKDFAKQMYNIIIINAKMDK